jgi:hypothetical protein
VNRRRELIIGVGESALLLSLSAFAQPSGGWDATKYRGNIGFDEHTLGLKIPDALMLQATEVLK